jgi:hypothetical protein
MPRPISRYHATHFSRLVSRRDELRRGRESRSPSFLVAATQQVRGKPRFRLAARPRSRTEASTRAPRAPRAHRAPQFPTGFGLARTGHREREISSRTETDPSPPPPRHTRPRRTQTHTMPKKRRANGRNKPAGARGHVRAPSPLRLSPTAIARATEPEPLGFLDRRADLRGDRAGPGAAREDARSGHRADYVLCHASGC